MSKDTIADLRKRVSEESHESPQPQMDIRRDRKTKVTAGELRTAVEACPKKDTCPRCKAFLKGIQGFPDNHEFIVDAVDLQAVLECCEVETVCTVEDGARVFTKRLKPDHIHHKPEPPKDKDKK